MVCSQQSSNLRGGKMILKGVTDKWCWMVAHHICYVRETMFPWPSAPCLMSYTWHDWRLEQSNWQANQEVQKKLALRKPVFILNMGFKELGMYLPTDLGGRGDGCLCACTPVCLHTWGDTSDSSGLHPWSRASKSQIICKAVEVVKVRHL